MFEILGETNLRLRVVLFRAAGTSRKKMSGAVLRQCALWLERRRCREEWCLNFEALHDHVRSTMGQYRVSSRY